MTTKEKIHDVYEHFKSGRYKIYDEEKHCKLLIKIMMDKDMGCVAYYCTKAMISESLFFEWVRKYPLFRDLYYFSKMVAKQAWYEEGKQIKNKEYQMGTINYEMDHWKLIGWAKFGISRNSKIKINVEPSDTPAKHYESILRQAADGDFTASEFKQLMEAVNVGLNVHQVYELQNQIDELKSDLAIVTANTHVKNPFANQGT